LVGWLVTDCIVNIESKSLKLLGSIGDPVRKKRKERKQKERKREEERSLAITTANVPATS
jgi:hypothetical protein